MKDKSLLNEALNNLMNQLLQPDSLYNLLNYKKRFPKGIFAKEAETKIDFLNRITQEEEKTTEEVIFSSSKKNEFLESILEKRTKFVSDITKGGNKKTASFFSSNTDSEDIIQYLEEKRISIANSDIEQILNEVLEVIPKLKISKSYFDSFISISAENRNYNKKQALGLLNFEDDQKMHHQIIDRLLKTFNLIISDFSA